MDLDKPIKLSVIRRPPICTFQEKVNIYFQQKLKYEWSDNTKKELTEIYNFMNSFENNNALRDEINVIDTLCCNAMKIMSNQDMLKTLCIMSGIYSKQMQKKMAYNINTFLPYVPDMKDLDIVEQCMIAESFFKATVKLRKDQIRQIEEVLEEKAEYLVDNDIYIVPLCKILRLTGCTEMFDLTCPERLVNTLLSSWMLNIRMKQVIEKSFKSGIFKKINDGILWKTKAKLSLLLYCIKIESPDIVIPEELIVQNTVGYSIPKTVETVYNAVSNSSDHLQLRNVKIDRAVPAIYIPGISCEHTFLGLIHIDVLDEFTCLKSPKLIPHGWMKLKLRLLKQIGYRSILVKGENITNAEDVNAYTVDCINEKLKQLL
ncbi:hypothetical protein KM043_004632 [Ampulex compressa]|nr:hypothetical protein KM043_004632 [Ampulex compressa]